MQHKFRWVTLFNKNWRTWKVIQITPTYLIIHFLVHVGGGKKCQTIPPYSLTQISACVWSLKYWTFHTSEQGEIWANSVTILTSLFPTNHLLKCVSYSLCFYLKWHYPQNGLVQSPKRWFLTNNLGKQTTWFVIGSHFSPFIVPNPLTYWSIWVGKMV